MDVFASECSSDCESGWTLYLEQSLLSQDKPNKFVEARSGFCGRGKNVQAVEDEDEDLSMVSDASSGPPHFPEDEGYFNYNNVHFYPAVKDNATTPLAKNCGRRQKQKKEHRRREVNEELPSCLDDTASSPAFNFSKRNFAYNSNQTSTESVLDCSQGFSATHFQGTSAYQDHHFGFVHPAPSENQFQNNQLSTGLAHDSYCFATSYFLDKFT
ncbi:hypothetical protein K2173_023904 [Erythroxylum novogranatense]|uniref:Uncharacterized protein n=1 Tax=Erythroxylum novogranatense TaxID=1862640 RepID=A0AAV8TS60_9ROSI|nr:hypothetical protein K2173_023904 [Erythroxylum novogranatense]